MKELEEIVIGLWNDGIWPPYTLVIGDGAGLEVAFNVTADIRFVGALPLAEGTQLEIRYDPCTG